MVGLCYRPKSVRKLAVVRNEKCMCRYTCRCLLPKRRASKENAPGPSIAEVAPIVANTIESHGSLRCANATHNSITAINVPAIGVQSPTRKRMLAHAPMMCGNMDAEKGEFRRWITQR